MKRFLVLLVMVLVFVVNEAEAEWMPEKEREKKKTEDISWRFESHRGKLRGVNPFKAILGIFFKAIREEATIPKKEQKSDQRIIYLIMQYPVEVIKNWEEVLKDQSFNDFMRRADISPEDLKYFIEKTFFVLESSDLAGQEIVLLIKDNPKMVLDNLDIFSKHAFFQDFLKENSLSIEDLKFILEYKEDLDEVKQAVMDWDRNSPEGMREYGGLKVHKEFVDLLGLLDELANKDQAQLTPRTQEDIDKDVETARYAAEIRRETGQDWKVLLKAKEDSARAADSLANEARRIDSLRQANYFFSDSSVMRPIAPEKKIGDNVPNSLSNRAKLDELKALFEGPTKSGSLGAGDSVGALPSSRDSLVVPKDNIRATKILIPDLKGKNP